MTQLKSENIDILEYTPRGGGAPFEKLELAFRNELIQTWANPRTQAEQR